MYRIRSLAHEPRRLLEKTVGVSYTTNYSPRQQTSDNDMATTAEKWDTSGMTLFSLSQSHKCFATARDQSRNGCHIEIRSRDTAASHHVMLLMLLSNACWVSVTSFGTGNIRVAADLLDERGNHRNKKLGWAPKGIKRSMYIELVCIRILQYFYKSEMKVKEWAIIRAAFPRLPRLVTSKQ